MWFLLQFPFGWQWLEIKGFFYGSIQPLAVSYQKDPNHRRNPRNACMKSSQQLYLQDGRAFLPLRCEHSSEAKASSLPKTVTSEASFGWGVNVRVESCIQRFVSFFNSQLSFLERRGFGSLHSPFFPLAGPTKKETASGPKWMSKIQRLHHNVNEK